MRKKEKNLENNKNSKKKKLVEGPSPLERKFNTAFPEYHIGKNIQASTSATVENSPDQIELSFEHER